MSDLLEGLAILVVMVGLVLLATWPALSELRNIRHRSRPRLTASLHSKRICSRDVTDHR